MPHWKPQEMGRLIKRTKHKAWCIMCGDELQKGDIIIRRHRHGVRLLCRDCDDLIKMSKEILRMYKERIR